MNHSRLVANLSSRNDELEAELAEAKAHLRALLDGIKQASIGAKRLMDENDRLRHDNYVLQLALDQCKGNVHDQ